MKTVLILIATILPTLLSGQSAERQVMGSAGSFAAADAFSHSYTVGETVIFTGTSSTLKVTQGFQQPDQMSVGIEETELAYAVNAFPNPTRGEVVLDISSEYPLNLNIDLFNMQGKQFPLPQRQVNVNGALQHSIDMSRMASGSYFIRITDEEGKTNNSIQIQKVN